MGDEPIFRGELKLVGNWVGTEKKQIPPLRCGMTNKIRCGMTNKKTTPKAKCGDPSPSTALRVRRTA
jgi:hypothetical protein